MKILHCADIHLDSKLNSNFDVDKSIERRNEILVSFRKMVEFAAQNAVDAVIIAGDLFDTGCITKSTVNMVRQCIGSNPEIDFYYLNGNHDEQYMLRDVEELNNFKIFNEDWTSYNADNEGRIVITGTTRQDLSESYRTLNLNEKSVNIVVLHGQLYENCGNDGICLSSLRHKNIDYLAMGHIHKYMLEKLDERGMYCYPGCLESRGFDECGDHGVVLLDIQDGKISQQFVPWGSRQSYYIDVDVSKCMDSSSCMDTIKQVLSQNGVNKEDMVEVVLTGAMDEASECNTELIMQDLKYSFYCVKIKDKTSIRIDYEKYVNDISLKGEFIKMVMNDGGIDADTKAEIIKTGLMALTGESV